MNAELFLSIYSLKQIFNDIVPCIFQMNGLKILLLRQRLE